jgi:penicillin-binding protein 1B
MLKQAGFRERQSDQSLFERDYAQYSAEDCLRLKRETDSSFLSEMNPTEEPPALSSCLALRTIRNSFFPSRIFWLTFTQENSILRGIFEEAETLQKKSWFSLDVEPLAMYLGSEPISQETVELGQIPVSCLQGVVAIEDREFLEHQGFSLWNIVRAGVTSTAGFFRGRRAHGGSTITQQLVKNYFLTHERTIERKYKELLLAIALENELTKDEILNLYLNVIYMGQNGPFQVRGFAAASKYYFDQTVSSLDLSQCAFLAAVLNSPGLYNPWSKLDRARARRNLVLEKMFELGKLSSQEKTEAQALPLKVFRRNQPFETAPYFLDGVRDQVQQLNLDISNKKILTTLDLSEQRIAQDAMTRNLDFLELRTLQARSFKKQGKSLEAAILISENSGRITTHIGGRSFRSTQFNRALRAHRQVGSLFKPLIYLKALEEGPWTNFSLINNDSVEIQVGGSTWKPQNYDKKTSPPVPLYLALINSFNLPSIHLAQSLGIESIIEKARAFGIQSPLLALPSLALGSFELFPYEVLKLYLGFANFGSTPELTWIDKVCDSEGNTLYEFQPQFRESSKRDTMARLISNLILIPQIGTAKGLRHFSQYQVEFAGKTGTTNDYKDSWFAGFTPSQTALVWVGYDDNSISGLTGASGAAPLWSDLMKTSFEKSLPQTFPWPKGALFQEIIIESETFRLIP